MESESIKMEKEIDKERMTIYRIKEEQGQLLKDIDNIKEYQARYILIFFFFLLFSILSLFMLCNLSFSIQIKSQQALLGSLNDVFQHLTETKNNLKENVTKEAIEQNKRRDEIELRLKVPHILS